MKIKKIIYGLILAQLLLLPKVEAARCETYSDNCCYTDPSWNVYADWLFWRARRSQLDFAFNGDPGVFGVKLPSGSVHAVEPSYDNGFRVGVQKYCGDLFFEGYYTYFRNEESKTAIALNGQSGTHVVDSLREVNQGNFQLSRGKWNLDYDSVDLLVGYQFNKGRCLRPYLFGGFKYASIDQELTSFYSEDVAVTGEVDLVKEKIDMSAYGVDIGVGANFSFWSCFNLFAKVSYDALIGDFKRRFTYNISSDGGATFFQDLNLNDQSWNSLSVFNLWFGLGFDRVFNQCWCSRLSLSIGYEFHQWINQLDFLEVQAESGENTFDRHLQSLGFDGLFIRFNVGF